MNLNLSKEHAILSAQEYRCSQGLDSAVQVQFVFGYSLKLHTVVKSVKGGLRQLSIPFSTPILNLPVRDLTVKVCGLLLFFAVQAQCKNKGKHSSNLMYSRQRMQQ